MFKPHHNELQSYLEWRRQTRFVRRHGGPIMAITLFAAGLLFVWRAGHSRKAAESPAQAEQKTPVEKKRTNDIDRFLQAAKTPRW